VAELVFAHAFTLKRYLHEMNRAMPVSGQTDFAKLKKKSSQGGELLGKTIGIIGIGRIGQEVARMAFGLGMDVVAVDPFVEEASIEINIPSVDHPVMVKIKTTGIDTLFAQSDVITVHIPKADKPLITSNELSKLKHGVLLINTARGGVFNEDALLEGLQSGVIGGVGLDVFTGEPTPRQDLLTHPRISLSPHIGGSTMEAQENVGKELAGLILKHFGK
jgi:D-3-phosphoglycerate dehydrogenase